MRYQAEKTVDRFQGGDRFVAHISMRVTANETAQVTGPKIMLAGLKRRAHTEGALVALGFFESLVVAAHG
jgi:hypothetical protein